MGRLCQLGRVDRLPVPGGSYAWPANSFFAFSVPHLMPASAVRAPPMHRARETMRKSMPVGSKLSRLERGLQMKVKIGE